MAEEKIREHITFEGRVQGVGFRYKLYHLANSYGVTGWVANNLDGTVDACMQGQITAIEIILQQLQQDRYIVIDRMLRKRILLDEKERRFGIKTF